MSFRKSKDYTILLVSILLLIFAFSLVGASRDAFTLLFGEKTTGTVTSVDSYLQSGGRRCPTQFIAVSFKKDNENEFTLKESLSCSQNVYAVGDKITVRYQKNTEYATVYDHYKFLSWASLLVLSLVLSFCLYSIIRKRFKDKAINNLKL